MSAVAYDDATTVLQRQFTWSQIRAKALTDPKVLIGHMKGFDPTFQEYFGFEMDDPDAPWGWQGLVIDWWMGVLTPEREQKLRDFMGWDPGEIDPKTRKFIILKARQLGVTWLAVALGLWYMLMRPGSNILCHSQGEDEAKLLVQRAWLMFNALPPELRGGCRVISPKRSEIPSEQIILRFADGRMSVFKALPDTAKAGHSETVTLEIMDEVARMDHPRGIYTAVNPAVARGGRLLMVSTADGVSNVETGEGNFFHHLWFTRKAKKLSAAFLPWNLHPERDEEWYENEAMALPHMERNQQYPLNPDNAFILSGDLYFDPDSISYYRGNTRRSKVTGQFVILDGEAAFIKNPNGCIELWELPRPGAFYGISADTATGRSQDYSAGHIIDLTSGDPVGEIRGKMDYPTFSSQLKCLGRWYTGPDGSGAKIIPERTGVGEALIALLRSNGDGLRAYGNIYQHVRPSDVHKKIPPIFGFPMQAGTRSLVLEKLRSALYKRQVPFLSTGTMDEVATFIYRESGTSPRAMDGCNDDRVMSLALAWYLYEEKGDTPVVAVVKKAWKKVQEYIAPTTMNKDWQPGRQKNEYGPGGRYAPDEPERNEDGSRKL